VTNALQLQYINEDDNAAALVLKSREYSWARVDVDANKSSAGALQLRDNVPTYTALRADGKRYSPHIYIRYYY